MDARFSNPKKPSRFARAAVVHESLRPHVESAQDLHALLVADQVEASNGLGWRMIGTLVCLVVALAGSGVVTQVALCLGLLMGMAWAWSLADYTARRWFLHYIDLQEIIRPRPDLAVELLGAMLAVDEMAREARCTAEEGEALPEAQDAANGGQNASWGAQEQHL